MCASDVSITKHRHAHPSTTHRFKPRQGSEVWRGYLQAEQLPERDVVLEDEQVREEWQHADRGPESDAVILGRGVRR